MILFRGGDLIGNSNRSFVNQAVAFRPLLANDDIPEEQFQTNPYAWTNDFTDFSRASRYIGSLSLTYKLPVKGLSYEAKFGGNIRNKDRRRWFGLTTFQGNDTGGQLTISKLNTKSYQFNNLIRFNRRFNRKHRINAVFGLTYDVRKVATSTYGVEDFITTQFSIEQPAFGQVIRRPLTLFKSDQQIFSILGRLNYTYDNKYILTATIRRDGVSKFSDGNKYGVFPSFALAWNAGNESFVQNLDLFESLKFRAGWGQIGNHGIGPYGTISNYGVLTSLYGNADGGTNVPIALLGLSNPDLTWETTEQL
ncbi:TonB-dependent receptor, partial [Flavobacteriaceae bacterium]|nr:TonB-dependent receptor [Flavobacteriaceae bacterium]